MKELNNIIITTLFFSALIGQEGWTTISPFDDITTGISGSFISANEGWFYQMSRDKGNVLYHTTDGCLTWESIIELPDYTNISYSFTNLQFVNENFGVTILSEFNNSTYENKEYFWITEDGGRHWTDMTDQELMYPEGQNYLHMRPFYFINEFVGFAGGSFDESNSRGRVYKTIDGGNSWFETEVPVFDSPLNTHWTVNQFYFLDEELGWAVTNGPNNWELGMALKTNNGGESWEIAIEPSYPNMNTVHFFDQDHGGVTGSDHWGGSLFLTENNFLSEPLRLESYELDIGNLLDAHYHSENDIWAVGQVGEGFKVLHSDNGGDTFVTDFMIEDTVFIYPYDIQLMDDVIYIFSTNRILKKNISGTVNTTPDDMLPSEVSIDNIYPNPFNPTTTIAFDVPEETHITFTIYDVMGRVVKELINENIQAGTHRVLWNGTNDNGQPIPSGMYFCQLKSDDYLETMKLVLLK